MNIIHFFQLFTFWFFAKTILCFRFKFPCNINIFLKWCRVTNWVTATEKIVTKNYEWNWICVKDVKDASCYGYICHNKFFHYYTSHQIRSYHMLHYRVYESGLYKSITNNIVQINTLEWNWINFTFYEITCCIL